MYFIIPAKSIGDYLGLYAALQKMNLVFQNQLCNFWIQKLIISITNKTKFICIAIGIRFIKILVLFMAKIISFAKYLYYKGGNTGIYPLQECLF